MGETFAKPSGERAPGPTQRELDILLEQFGVRVSPEQYAVLSDRHRVVQVAGGERAGKSWVSGCFGASRTPYGRRYWIIADTYELARPEFDYWIGHLETVGAFKSKRDISIPKIGKAVAVTKSGQIIETKSADDVKKIAAIAPDGIIMAEAAQLTFETYLKCMGRVAEKRGWLLLSGTFEGSSGWYPEKFDEWRVGENIDGARSYSLPSWSNVVIYPGGRQDPEIVRLEAAYSRVPGMFEERMGAVPVPPANLIFRDFRQTIHVDSRVEFNPQLPVYLAVDPSSGGDPYAIYACQFEPFKLPDNLPDDLRERELANPDKIDVCNVIDEYYEVSTITEDIIEDLKKRVWWKNVRGGAMDPEAPDERKRFQKYGKVTLWQEPVDIFAGIRRLKSFLHYKRDQATQLVLVQPHLKINPKCVHLVFELGHFKRKMIRSEVLEDPNHILDKPDTNQFDHAVKALWYLLIARYGDVKAVAKASSTSGWKPPNYRGGSRATTQRKVV